jgi:hypothetical protein
MTGEGTSRGRDRASTKRVSEMTDEGVRELTTAPSATTYWQAQNGCRSRAPEPPAGPETEHEAWQ